MAVVNSAGQYMSSTGTFTSTTDELADGVPEQPRLPGSNYSYTTPVIPAGTYTVRVRGVDNHGIRSRSTATGT